MSENGVDIDRKLLEAKRLFVEASQQNLLHFTYYTMPNFKPADFHCRYYALLTKFARGEIKKMMIFMPPQHGKSEGSTRRLPSFLLGINPNLRIAIISYNSPKARKFNREIQRIIDTPEYQEIFPNTRLNRSNVVNNAKGNWVRNADEFEIINHEGGLKAVGVGGPLTGDPVDVLIMDDIYKDAATAWSPIYREKVNDWYDTVAETRLHNESQQLIVFTRWHEDDLAGRLIKEQGEYNEDNPNGWVICVFPAIKEGAPTEHDPRQEGEPLWSERHSLEKLLAAQKRSPYVFQSLYQQNPQPKEGLLYTNFKEYECLPVYRKQQRKNYTDTADTGADYLCSIDYIETEVGLYVLDVLYTQKPIEYTQVAQAKMMDKDRIEVSNIESNNGGRPYALKVEENLRVMGNHKCKVRWFAQTNNKEVRIFSHSDEVQNMIYFPAGWRTLWPEFAACISGYLRVGRNPHDDAPDVLTGMIEKINQGWQSAAGYF